MELRKTRQGANADVENTKAGREDLNSAHGIASRGPFGRALRILGYSVLISYASNMALPGASMAQTKPVVRAPSESKGIENEIMKAKDAVTEAEVALLAKMNASRVNPREIITLTGKFFDALANYNEKMKPYNGGNAPIPLSGATSEERQRSFNTWLGLAPDANMTADSLKAFDLKIISVYTLATSGSAMDTLDRMRDAEAAKGQKPASPTPVPVLVPTEGTLADRTSDLTRDLTVIMQVYPKNSTEYKTASGFKTYFDAALKAKRPPKDSEIDAKIAKASVFVYDKGTLDKAEATANEKAFLSAHKDMKTLDLAAQHPLYKRTKDLLDQLAGNNDTTAKAIKAAMPDLWLMGDPQAQAVLKIMEDAASKLVIGNNPAEAVKIFAAAPTLMANEQALFRRMVGEVIIPAGESAIAYDAKAPTWKDLGAAEKELKLPAGTLAIRSKDKLDRYNGKRNGREDLEADMKARMETAKGMLAAGKISFAELSKLYDAVTLSERTSHSLMDMWQLAVSSKLDSLDDELKIKVWTAYAQSAITMVDSNYETYKFMSKQQRLAIVMLTLGITDQSQLSAKQIAEAERKIIPTLARSDHYRYSDTLYNLYQQVVLIPALLTDETSKGIASQRAFKAVAEVQYAMYLTGIIGSSALDKDKDMASVKRLTTARDILSRAVDAAVASGLPEKTDEMVLTCKAWLKATADPSKYPAAKIPAVSDLMYGAAMSIASIREAELWSLPSASVLRPSTTKSGDIEAAQRGIALARDVFSITFSGVNDNPELQVISAYHYNPASEIGKNITASLAPRALRMTDSNDNSFVLQGNMNPVIYAKVADSSNPTLDERRMAAFNNELRHLSLLAKIKDDPAFGQNATDAALRSKGLLGPFKAVDPRVSRETPPDVTLKGFPKLEVIKTTKGLTFGPNDIHYVSPLDQGPAAALPHEDLAIARYGGLYWELGRLAVLHSDPQAPELLRQLDKAPNDVANPQLKKELLRISQSLGLDPKNSFVSELNAAMLRASTAYNTDDAAKMQGRVNDIFLGALDARIAELRALVATPMEIKGGKKVSVSDLAKYKDPRAKAARFAISMLSKLEGIRKAQSESGSLDQLEWLAPPGLADVMAEMGSANLDPANFKQIPEEKLGIGSEPVEYRVAVRKDTENLEHEGHRYGSFHADITAVVGEGTDESKKKRMSLKQYGDARGTPVAMLVGWIGIEEFRTSSGRPVVMLVNPARTSGSWNGEGGAFVGRYMENIRFPDGHTGNAFVRVQKNSERSGTDYSNAMDYEPVKINNQYDIVYEVAKPKPGEEARSPYLPVDIDNRARHLCMKTLLPEANFTFRSGAEPMALAFPNVKE